MERRDWLKQVILSGVALAGTRSVPELLAQDPRRVIRYQGRSDEPHYELVRHLGGRNVVVRNLEIVGDRSTHRPRRDKPGAADEFGHGIYLADVESALIEDVEVRDCWGDGIVLAFNHPRTAARLGVAQNVTIRRVTVRNCRRNAISMIGAQNVLVEDSRFLNTNGVPPMAGCDLEPEHPSYPNRDITFRRCTFEGNRNMAFGVDRSGRDSSWVYGVVVEDSVLRAHQNGWALWFLGATDRRDSISVFRRCRIYGPVVHLANVRFEDCQFFSMPGNTQSPRAIAVENGERVEFVNCTVDGRPLSREDPKVWIRGAQKMVRG